MGNKRTEYLDYVKLLYDRESSKGKQSGITKWGVVIALVYVTWHLIESFPKIKDDQISLHSAIFLYGLIQLSIDNFSPFFTSSIGISKTSRYGRRINRNEVENYLSFSFSWMLFSWLPLLSLFYRDKAIFKTPNLIFETKFIEIQATINFYMLSFFILMLIINSIYYPIYKKIKDHPPPPTLFPNSTFSNWSRVAFILISLEIAIGSAIAAYMTLNFFPSTNLSLILTCSFDMVLIVSAIRYLTYSRLQNVRIAKISSLERDIIFHNLTTAEIKTRIQEEFIGHEVGEWLKDKLNEMKYDANLLIEMSENSKEQLAWIEALPEGHKYEKSGRLKEFMANMTSALESYEKKILPLLEWLRIGVANCDSQDKYLLSSLNELYEEASEIHNLTSLKIKGALSDMKAIIV